MWLQKGRPPCGPTRTHLFYGVCERRRRPCRAATEIGSVIETWTGTGIETETEPMNETDTETETGTETGTGTETEAETEIETETETETEIGTEIGIEKCVGEIGGRGTTGTVR